MLRKERWLWILIALFILVAAVRFFLAFSTPGLEYEGYEMVRRVEHITQTGTPLYNDELSFSGRTRLFSPLYDYILALFGLFIPSTLLIKILPNLFAASLVFPAFLLASLFTKKRWAAIIAAGMTGLVPAGLRLGINDGSVLSLSLPVMFLSLYLFLNSRKSGKQMQRMLISLTVLAVLSPVGIILLLALLFYLFLLRVVGVKVNPKEVEVTLFYLFLSSWFYLIIFKRALVMHGGSVVWQNTPAAVLGSVFAQVNLLGVIGSVGMVTLVAGAIALYLGLATTKRRSLLLLGSMVIVSGLLMWLRLLTLGQGLAILATALAILSGYALERMYLYTYKMRASALAVASVIIFVALFILTSIPPTLSVSSQGPSSAELSVALWAKEGIASDAVVFVPPLQGDMVAALAHKQVVIDDDFVLIPRVEERYGDVVSLYKAVFATNAIEIMQKYGATHVFVSPQSAQISGVDSPRFLHGSDCFKLVKSEVNDDGSLVQLFERTCSIRGGSSG